MVHSLIVVTTSSAVQRPEALSKLLLGQTSAMPGVCDPFARDGRSGLGLTPDFLDT
jgi:hypothetical protein